MLSRAHTDNAQRHHPFVRHEDYSLLVRRLQEHERQTSQHIAHALHDQLGQTLAAMRMQLELLKPDAGQPAASTLMTGIRRLDAMLDQALRGVRGMVSSLRPPHLLERGLVAALEQEIAAQKARTGANVVLRRCVPLDDVRFALNVEYDAFMIAREAIGNALRHARASAIQVSIDGNPREFDLCVADDGIGMPADAAARPAGTGFADMCERARAIGATLAITPNDPCGLRVTLHWNGRD